MNFSYMQSLALCAAYITGINKESSDVKIFEKRTQGGKSKAVKPQGSGKDGIGMVGKSKRFSLERYSAILDYLISTQAEKS